MSSAAAAEGGAPADGAAELAAAPAAAPAAGRPQPQANESNLDDMEA